MPRLYKRFRPRHLEAIRLHWHGYTNGQIAAQLGYTEQSVSNIINSEQGLQIIDEVMDHRIDSMVEVQDELQLIAPVLLHKKIELALAPGTEDKLRDKSLTDLLAMAGHGPVRRVSIDRAGATESKYQDLTEQQLKDEILRSLRPGGATPNGGTGSGGPVPPVGPDGNPLQ